MCRAAGLGCVGDQFELHEIQGGKGARRLRSAAVTHPHKPLLILRRTPNPSFSAPRTALPILPNAQAPIPAKSWRIHLCKLSVEPSSLSTGHGPSPPNVSSSPQLPSPRLLSPSPHSLPPSPPPPLTAMRLQPPVLTTLFPPASTAQPLTPSETPTPSPQSWMKCLP
jgi:hypothetical protein